MSTYEIQMDVNGRRTVVTITAYSLDSAVKIAKDQYAGQKVSVFTTRKVG
jgi:hypothetical protein